MKIKWNFYLKHFDVMSDLCQKCVEFGAGNVGQRIQLKKKNPLFKTMLQLSSETAHQYKQPSESTDHVETLLSHQLLRYPKWPGSCNILGYGL